MYARQPLERQLPGHLRYPTNPILPERMIMTYELERVPIASRNCSRDRILPPSARGFRRPLSLTAVLVATVVILTLASGTARAGAFDAGALPRRDLLERALASYRRVEGAGLLRTKILTIIDYALPSSQRRLWVLDPDRLRVLYNEYVAHGRGSTTDASPDYAVRFGNEASSHRSSLGTFLTGTTYTGKHGHSLELIGLEPGVNDNARERRIVVHPADYMSAAFRAHRGGQVGRSWGCPALDPAVAPAIIDRIQDGSVLYVAGGSTQQLAAMPGAHTPRYDAQRR